MRCLCKRLEENGVDLSQMHALEFFAREGDWQAVAYSDKVYSIDAWEIDPAFREGLKQNLPMARITIGDSFNLAKIPKNSHKFDFIVFDNPQGHFGPNNCYCEHFQALDLIPLLMPEECIAIFNVNKRPFDYAKHLNWKASREKYYGSLKTEEMDSQILLDFYQEKFLNLGLTTVFSFEEQRNMEYLSYLAFSLKRM